MLTIFLQQDPLQGGTARSLRQAKTDFNLRCRDWESDNTPLSYQFQYRLEDGLYDVLHRGVNNNISTSSIPPGHSTDNFTVKVIATVTDNFGISASPVTLTVQVSR